MARLEIVCMTLGALLVVASVALVYWPAAIGVVGVALIAAGWPRDRS